MRILIGFDYPYTMAVALCGELNVGIVLVLSGKLAIQHAGKIF